MTGPNELERVTALAMDTTSATQWLAVAGGKVLEASFPIPRGGSHTETLLHNIDRLLRDSGLTGSSLDCLGAVTGPGSFSGIRIGLAAASGLADGLGIPLVGRNALELAALDASLPDGWIAPVQDARRGKFFVTVFKRHGCGLERVEPYREVTETELTSSLLAYPGATITCIGDGFPEGFTARQQQSGTRVVPGSGRNLAAILAGEIVRGAPVSPAGPIRAFYIRAADARLPAGKSLAPDQKGEGLLHADP